MENEINKLFVPYEIAKQLKQKGFDEPCLGHYQDNIEMFSYKPINGKLNLGFLGECKSEPYKWNSTPKWGVKSQVFYSAPLYQQVVDWFREKHKICIQISQHDYMWGYSMYNTFPPYKSYKWVYEEKDYYEALNKAIEDTLKLI